MNKIFVLSIALLIFLNCGSRNELPNLNVGGGIVKSYTTSSSGDTRTCEEKCLPGGCASCSGTVSGKDYNLAFCEPSKAHTNYEALYTCVCKDKCIGLCDGKESFCTIGKENKDIMDDCFNCMHGVDFGCYQELFNCNSDLP